ncbi:Heat shock 70 kDa protein [Rhynchospora pubera]|uniref:Heat shock 70 kDa protein n=1 Tax=Rhynchospora pubera TaxID=906938 RepID=A0AAV8BSQ7_9POAL|nr:Heat shock 70 kDa protein [Rhynchospora pubera]
MGRRFSDKSVQNDIKHWPFKVVAGPMDRPKIIVNYRGVEKEFYAEEISSMILVKMKEVAEAYLECPVKNAVITVPAYFNDSQRQATKNAGVIAGLNVMRIMDEPTAAAIAYGFDKITENTDGKKLLIFDLGGGTFDVSLLSVRPGNFVVRATAGDTHLGGEDFDDRLVDYCVKEIKTRYNKDITQNAKSLRRLRTACERAKRNLSFSLRATIEIDSLYDGLDFSTHISRSRFEELNIDLFKKCTDLIEECLSDAKIDKTDVDAVVLVGGSARIPKVQELVQDLFEGKELCKGINLDEAVAYGAAIQAACLNGQHDKRLKNLVLVNVTPLSLGFEVIGDRTEIAVPRNTPIPIKMHSVGTTYHDNQTSVIIPIYEGERAETKYNNMLGEFTLEGIDPAPKGDAKIDIVFDIDSDGILTVSAQDRKKGHGNKIVVAKQGLTTEEIQKMAEDAAHYKAEDEEYKAKVSLEDFADKVKAMAKNPALSAEEKKSMEAAAENVILWLKTNQHADINEIKIREDQLEMILHRLMKLKRGGIPYDHVLVLSREPK